MRPLRRSGETIFRARSTASRHRREAPRYLTRLVLDRVDVKEAHISSLEINVNRLTSPPSAEAKFLAVGQGKDRKGEWPYKSFARHVTLTLRLEGGRWLVTGYKIEDFDKLVAMKQLRNAAILVGLAAYAIVFYTTPMPSLSRLMRDGKPWWRGETGFRAPAFGRTNGCWPNWFGSPPQFSLDDRAARIAGGRVHSRLGRRPGLAAAFDMPRHARTDTSGNRGLLDGRRIEPAEHVDAGGGSVRATRPAAGRRRAGIADLRGRRRLLVLAQTL